MREELKIQIHHDSFLLEIDNEILVSVVFPDTLKSQDHTVDEERSFFIGGSLKAAAEPAAFFRGGIGNIRPGKHFKAVDRVDDKHGDCGTDNVLSLTAVVIRVT
jgi:hypothetical protein